MIIAIDGPSASGKGTLARRLARELGFAYLDTGQIYRAVAARVLDQGGDPGDADTALKAAKALDLSALDRPDLREERVAQAASVVAAIPAVRAALLDLQRRFAAAPPGGEPGAVLDGRDIGTVVCPDAPVKLFVTADLATRAARRHKELRERGETSIYAHVVQEMEVRDARDSARATAPLKPAPDAIVLDTSEMDADAAFRAASELIASKRTTDTSARGPAKGN
jgi:cytidylate kinase